MIYQIKVFKKNRKVSEKITHVNDVFDLNLLVKELFRYAYSGFRVSFEDITKECMEEKKNAV